MHYLELDTPALLVNKPIMLANIDQMAAKAARAGVKLRPHTKTHRTPAIAKIQVSRGAAGITVAKTGEAEVMLAQGLDDIFIANQIVGDKKLLRLREINRKARLAVGVDAEAQVMALASAFRNEPKPIDVLIEIETGEERTGVQNPAEAVSLARLIARTPGVRLRGVFSHEGHTYSAVSPEQCSSQFADSQATTLAAAEAIRQAGLPVEEVSIGATPSLLHGEILPGITEIRPGTYVFMDAAQGQCIGDFSRCALTVLATVISLPSPERVVVDAGVKALTSFTRPQGICNTPGYGMLKGFNGVRLKKLYDEHGIIIDPFVRENVRIGDKIEIIPNHACPTCNLYDQIYVVENEKVVDVWPVLGRGKSQ